MNLKTTTTDFKRALNTLKQGITNSDLRDNDIPVKVSYANGLSTLSFIHPATELYVKTEFPIIESNDINSCVVSINELLKEMKKYRKKEEMKLETTNAELKVSVNDDEVSFSLMDDYFSPISYSTIDRYQNRLKVDVKLNKNNFVELMNQLNSITSTTFHPSTNHLDFVVHNDKIHGKSTNFEQFSYAHIVADEVVNNGKYPFVITGDDVTKVRNIIDRSKGEKMAISEADDYILFITETSTVGIAKDIEDISLSAKSIAQYVSQTSDANIATWKTFIEEKYSKLREFEKSKNKEMIEENESVYFYDGELVENISRIGLGVRDVRNVLNQLNDEVKIGTNDYGLTIAEEKENKKITFFFPEKR